MIALSYKNNENCRSNEYRRNNESCRSNECCRRRILRLSLLDCRKIVDSFSLDCVIIPGDPTWGLQLLKNRPITWTVFLKSV